MGMTNILRWAAMGFPLLLVGCLIIWLTIPAVQTEVVARGSIVAGEPVTTLGPHHLEDGRYAVWIEDMGSNDDVPYRVQLVGEGGTRAPTAPQDREGGTFEGVQCELIALFSDVPEGDWRVVLTEATDTPMAQGEIIEVFVVKTPRERDRTAMKAALVLAVSGLVVVEALLLTKGRRDRREGEKNGDGNEGEGE
jgi:hypothetical protein